MHNVWRFAPPSINVSRLLLSAGAGLAFAIYGSMYSYLFAPAHTHAASAPLAFEEPTSDSDDEEAQEDREAAQTHVYAAESILKPA